MRNKRATGRGERGTLTRKEMISLLLLLTERTLKRVVTEATQSYTSKFDTQKILGPAWLPKSARQ